jgi:hypothetical protein
MAEYRVSFDEIEDGVVTLPLYKDEEFQRLLRYDIDELPEGASPDDQFRPEFNDDGEVVALHYDEELTQRKHEEFADAVERHRELLDDS